MRVIIAKEYAGWRLDKFLKEQYPDFSRSYIQKAIEAGQVLVNNKKITVHHFLKIGDEVEVKIEPPAELLVVSSPEVRIEVMAEEKDFLIINKSAGLVVHQGEGHKEADTLANGLLARYPEIGKVGDDPLRPGIVHRLDGDVSGVMVVARTQDMFDHLKQQFKTHQTEKEYLALVHGQVTPSEGVIEFALEKKGTKMVARPKGGEGKKAVTEYETVTIPESEGVKGKATLLKIRIHTGRTHQIRVHLFALGYPIVGDKLYGKTGEVSRLMLHARKIVFEDLKGERREFIIEPPSEFRK